MQSRLLNQFALILHYHRFSCNAEINGNYWMFRAVAKNTIAIWTQLNKHCWFDFRTVLTASKLWHRSAPGFISKLKWPRINLSIDRLVEGFLAVKKGGGVFCLIFVLLCYLLDPCYPHFLTFNLSQFNFHNSAFPFMCGILLFFLAFICHFTVCEALSLSIFTPRHTFTLHYVITAAKRDAQCVQRHKPGQPQG